jgi:hypothetical protein
MSATFCRGGLGQQMTRPDFEVGPILKMVCVDGIQIKLPQPHTLSATLLLL